MEFIFKATDTQKHSAAHALAAAVNRIFPNVRIGAGPVTKSGFYYDFELANDITPNDIESIEEEIKNIIAEDLKFTQTILPYDQGSSLLLQQGQLYKHEILKSIKESTVSFYKLGSEFTDLCRGPHINSTSELVIVKITNVTKVHWNNDNTKPLLTRVEGSVFISEQEFHDFIDFRKKTSGDTVSIARTSNIIFYDSNKNSSLTPRGTLVRQRIDEFIAKLFSEYNLLGFKSPAGIKHVSDFLSNYVKSNPISYKNLPLIFQENENLINSDLSSQLPLSKSIFTMITSKSDALIQIGNLFENVATQLDKFCLNASEVEIRCSNLDDLFVVAISNLLQKRIISHTKVLSFNMKDQIEISIRARDNSGGSYNIATMLLKPSSGDFPIINNTNQVENSSTLVISIDKEGFFGFLLNQFGMDLPFEFHPVQVLIIPISKENFSFSKDVFKALKSLGLNCHIDLSSQSMKYKIRRGEINFAKFILIIGQKEETNNAVSVRQKSREVGLISLDKLAQFIIDNRS